jgi:hypothetical protein
MVEMYSQIQSDSGLLDDTSALRRWSMAYLESLAATQVSQGRKDRHAPRRLKAMMIDAGFVDVEMSIRNVPMSPWPEGTSSCPKGLVEAALTGRRPCRPTNRRVESAQHEELDASVGSLSSDAAQWNGFDRLQPAYGRSGRGAGATAPEALLGVVGVQSCSSVTTDTDVKQVRLLRKKSHDPMMCVVKVAAGAEEKDLSPCFFDLPRSAVRGPDGRFAPFDGG